MTEPLPCPFCGEMPRVSELQPRVVCETKGCPLEGVAWIPIEAWNRRAPGWMDIETAPKDGTYILVHCEATGVGVAHWAKVGRNSGWSSDHGWWQETPTYWQPLPDAPKE